MSDLGFGVEELAQLIRLVEKRNLRELIVENDDRRVVIRGESYQRFQRIAPSTDSGTGTNETVQNHPLIEVAPSLPVQVDMHADKIAVTSPMVGVFYRASGPGQPAFVEVGDHVEVGQTIGLLEAMKVFSEIEAEESGTVREIVVQNGQLVKPNDPLIYLSKS